MQYCQLIVWEAGRLKCWLQTSQNRSPLSLSIGELSHSGQLCSDDLFSRVIIGYMLASDIVMTTITVDLMVLW